MARGLAARRTAAFLAAAARLRVKAIQEHLDSFFGPFMQMSGVNRLLSRDLRERQSDSSTFLLIEKLFDRQWLKNLPVGEQAIVGEIAANAKVLREFITKNAKMGNLRIQPYLSRVSAHYRILELAYEGQLGDDAKPFVSRYVFTRQIDDVLALEVAHLERRMEFLRFNPAKPTPPIEELIIPDEPRLKEWANPPREARPELNVAVAQPGGAKASDGKSYQAANNVDQRIGQNPGVPIHLGALFHLRKAGEIFVSR